MSEKNQVVVVMIVTLLLGAFLDRPTALKMVAGAGIDWKAFLAVPGECLSFENIAETQSASLDLHVSGLALKGTTP